MNLKIDKRRVELKRAIIKLIAFFDLFSYSLTSREVWQYLDKEADWQEVEHILQELVAGKIENKEGFYFLKGREEIIRTRQARYNYAQTKIKRARRVARLLKQAPGVRLIAVSNLIGAFNLKKEGDIDIFIITEPGKLWSARFFCVLMMKILGLRPKPGQEKDKVCLNFFLSSDRLNLEDLRLDNDIYFRHWFVHLIPVFNQNYTLEDFLRANKWLRQEFPNWQISFPDCEGKRAVTNKLSNLLAWERVWRRVQLNFMSPDLKKKKNQDSCVVVNDSILKLHSKDRREYYREEFFKKIINDFLGK